MKDLGLTVIKMDKGSILMWMVIVIKESLRMVYTMEKGNMSPKGKI
jgi:hypothetical protein